MSHHKKAPDGLDASILTLSDNGKNLRIFRDTRWTDANGVEHIQTFRTHQNGQKGLRTILTERGLFRQHMLRQCPPCKNKVPHEQRADPRYGLGEGHWQRSQQCCAVYTLSQQPDFAAQQEWLAETIQSHDDCHIIFYPKFHCELNFIELIWAFMKSYLRKRCENNYARMKALVPEVLNNHVSLRLVRRVVNHTLRFMDGYRLALDGPLLDFAMKNLVGKRRVPIDTIPTIREDFDKHMQRKLTKTT